MIGIYKWTSPSGKIYIGQSTDLERRKKEFLTNPTKYSYNTYESAIDKARRKYNDFNLWNYEIICTCTIEELDILEQEIITKLNTTDSKIGYNSAKGGKGVKGVKWGTPKQIKSLNDRKSVKGENNPMYGKHHTQEVKEKISKVNKGRKLTKKHIESISKPVLQYTKDGEYLREWESMTEASKHIGISKAMISKACKGIKKSAGGYRWCYK